MVTEENGISVYAQFVLTEQEHNTMWIYKSFKTQKAFQNFLDKNSGKIQWQLLFVNNIHYAIEYRRLRRVY